MKLGRWKTVVIAGGGILVVGLFIFQAVLPREPLTSSSLPTMEKTRIATLTEDLKRLADEKALSQELVRVAKERHDLLVPLTESDPTRFLQEATLAKERLSLPASVRDLVEDTLDIKDAVVQLYHADTFDDRPSINELILVADTNKRIIIPITQKTSLNLKPGTRVSGKAIGINNSYIMDMTTLAIVSE